MLKRFSVVVLLSLFVFGIMGAVAQEGLAATTSGNVNLRAGPGTDYAVIVNIPHATPITLLGRDEAREWLYADYQGQRGWAYYLYVNTEGRLQTLPVVAADGVAISAPVEEAPVEESATTSPSSDEGGATTTTTIALPVNPLVISRITNTSRTIFRQGQQFGNRADVFSKVGDSVTASPLFLAPIGSGAYQLGGYDPLQGVIDFFSQTGARDHYSFANTSIAARSGFTTSLLLDPQFSPAGVCHPGESPLVCEYRLVKPAVALIMIGTNDVTVMDAATYEANLRRIMDITIDMGIIPVLSTIPDRPNSPYFEKARQFNMVIRAVCASYDTPLWDYWSALQGLHNYGLSEDNTHPSYNPTFGSTVYFDSASLSYGYNVRNLTALQVLDALWRSVLS